MKVTKEMLRMAVLGVCLSGGAWAVLAQEAPLTRAQWLKRIGASVTEQGVLNETFERVAPADKVEYAQKVIRASAKLPAEPSEKSATLVRSAVGLIGGVSGVTKQQVIAEVFAGVPIEYLPTVTEELAKRFDQEYNKLTDEQYESFASETLALATKRNASTDVPSVRNTFVVLAFLRGAKAPELKNRLIAKLPDERQRNLAAGWIPPALNDRNYGAMLAASDVEPLGIQEHLLLGMVGSSNLDRLLADLNANLAIKPVTSEGVETAEGMETQETVWLPLSDVRTTGGIIGYGLSGSQLDHMSDYGINRVPRPMTEILCQTIVWTPCGYQNQRVTITTPLPVRH